MLAIRPFGSGSSFDLMVQTDEFQKQLDSWYAEGRLDLFLRNQDMVWAFPLPEPPADVPPKIGQIHWPVVGAQRFAVGHLLIDYYTLGRLQTLLEDNNRVEILLSDDPDNALETPRVLDMYLVDARPVVRTDTGTPAVVEPDEDDAWIITVVDRRWYWRQQYGRDSRTITDWNSLFDSLINKLIAGGTVDIDGIPTQYKEPSCRWSPSTNLQPFSRAALLDAAASAVGARIVVAPGSATWYIKQPFPSYTVDLLDFHDSAILLNRHTAGGGTEPTVVYPRVPEKVRVAFIEEIEGLITTAEFKYKTVSLSSLGLAEPDADKTISATEIVLWSDLPGDSTDTELTGASQQLAESFYVWQTAPLDAVYAGFILPPANPFIGDVLFFHSATAGYTRVSRPPVNWIPTYWLQEPGPFGSCETPEEQVCDCDQCPEGAVPTFNIRFSGSLPGEFESARGSWSLEKFAPDPEGETEQGDNCLWLSENPDDHTDWSMYLEYDGTKKPEQAGKWTIYLIKADETIWAVWEITDFQCCTGGTSFTLLVTQTTGSDPDSVFFDMTTEGDCSVCEQGTTTTTTTTAGPGACTGRCKFDWDTGTKAWVLSTSECVAASNCYCLAPRFCPPNPEFSACVYTDCGNVPGDEPIPNCTGTTTTDGACLTTTTTTGSTPGVCQYKVGACSWFCDPLHGWVSNSWDPVPEANRCGQYCPGCPLPSIPCDPSHWCETAETPCEPPQPNLPPECTGYCTWIWTRFPDGTEGWQFVTRLSRPCQAVFPSDPYNQQACKCDTPPIPVPAPQCGSLVTTYCYWHITTTTTTTAGPNCSPQPPLTTTAGVPGSCSGKCIWKANSSGVWEIVTKCSGLNCGCADPLDDPTSPGCETTETACVTGDFTTTTTTTGGCTPCSGGYCEWSCPTHGGSWQLDTYACLISGTPNCGCSTPSGQCTTTIGPDTNTIRTDCCFGGTTTTAGPTTTTTTTTGPGTCTDSNCLYECQPGSSGTGWQLVQKFCFVGCNCPDPMLFSDTCSVGNPYDQLSKPCEGSPNGCTNNCTWQCLIDKTIGGQANWALVSSFCDSGLPGCDCGSPETECTPDTVGTSEQVPCGAGVTSTTTSPGGGSGEWYCLNCGGGPTMCEAGSGGTSPSVGGSCEESPGVFNTWTIQSGPHADEATCTSVCSV